jgi:hypothetical protein
MQRRQQRGVEAEPQWPATWMAVGVLVAIVAFWTVGHRTLISYNAYFRWLAVLCFTGNLLPRRLYAERLPMDGSGWFWFNLLAVGPILWSVCLSLNFLVHGPEQRMLVVAGAGQDLHEHWRLTGSFPPHRPWPSDWGADQLKDQEALSGAGPDDQVYALAEGCLGWLVITEVHGVQELLQARQQTVR